MALVAIFTACILTGCGKEKDSDDDRSKSKSSPSAVVEKYFKALEEYDKTAIKKCFYDEHKAPSAYKLTQMREARMKWSLKKIENEEVDAGEATVDCVVEVSMKKNKAKGGMTFILIKDDGKWLITECEPDDDFAEEYLEILMNAME